MSPDSPGFRKAFPTASDATLLNTADISSRRPRFKRELSPFLKLPPGRKLGMVMCVDVGPDGHVWVLHSRRYVTPGFLDTPEERQARLPEVVEFDSKGNFIQAWGGVDHLPKADGKVQWPQLEETIAVDGEGGVWIFGSVQTYDHAALRFSRDGKLLQRIGEFGVAGTDESRDLLGCPTDVYLDAASREAFISDGYFNHRLVSFNVDSGAFIRAWGPYGKSVPTRSGDGPAFETVHSVVRGPDGYLYVCDRVGNRVQVFDAIGRKDAEFVRELEVAPNTGMYGSVAEVAFSPDGAFMYVADNSNFCIWIACMKTWRVIGWFAGKPVEGSGNTPDTYYTPHRIALDSEGNMLVARVAGGLERYIFEGVS